METISRRQWDQASEGLRIWSKLGETSKTAELLIRVVFDLLPGLDMTEGDGERSHYQFVWHGNIDDKHEKKI